MLSTIRIWEYNPVAAEDLVVGEADTEDEGNAEAQRNYYADKQPRGEFNSFHFKVLRARPD